jgi:hypothetical protein
MPEDIVGMFSRPMREVIFFIFAISATALPFLDRRPLS